MIQNYAKAYLMKVKCQRQSLLKGLQAITGVITQRDIYPILENVLVLATNNTLLFKATDLKISLTYSVPPTDFDIVEEGEVLVSASKFCNIIKETPDEQVLIEKSNFDAKITCNDGTFKILGEEPGKFPAVPEFEEGESVEIQGTDFQKLIKKTLFATTSLKTRYDLDNVLVLVSPEGLRFVATDGKRLSQMARRFPSVATKRNPSGDTRTRTLSKS